MLFTCCLYSESCEEDGFQDGTYKICVWYVSFKIKWLNWIDNQTFQNISWCIYMWFWTCFESNIDWQILTDLVKQKLK